MSEIPEKNTILVKQGYNTIKQIIDRVAAIVFLLVLSPALFMIGLLLFLIEGKVFFIQERPGYQGRPFKMYKFITMSEDDSMPDNLRVTRFGFLLRKLSIDELPQLINILKGEMSFIGPRPFLKEYLPLYSDHHMARHQVMPGITGLAQVSGKNEVTWQEKLDLDVHYVNHISFGLDVKIVGLTVMYFLRGCPGSYPAERFKGYQLKTAEA